MIVAQIAPDTKLDFDRQQVTMDEVLQAVLEPVGLKYVVAGPTIGDCAAAGREPGSAADSRMTFRTWPATTNRRRRSPN